MKAGCWESPSTLAVPNAHIYSYPSVAILAQAMCVQKKQTSIAYFHGRPAVDCESTRLIFVSCKRISLEPKWQRKVTNIYMCIGYSQGRWGFPTTQGRPRVDLGSTLARPRSTQARAGSTTGQVEAKKPDDGPPRHPSASRS